MWVNPWAISIQCDHGERSGAGPVMVHDDLTTKALEIGAEGESQKVRSARLIRRLVPTKSFTQRPQLTLEAHALAAGGAVRVAVERQQPRGSCRAVAPSTGSTAATSVRASTGN